MKALLSTIVVLVVGAATFTLAPTSAVAQPQIIQTGCDTLSFNPPRVHVTFAVVNLGQIPVCSVHLIPIPSGPNEPCRIFECSHPDGWVCNVDSLGGSHWQSLTPSACIRPFDKLADFDIIIDPPYCCYRVLFDDPGGNIFYDGVVCLQCESPTGTTRRSWGNVKKMYR